MKTHIDPTLKNFFDMMPGCWGCKDLDSTFQYANAEYAKIMGLTHHLDAVGRTDFDMPCDTVSSYAEIFREQDQSVLYSKKILQTLDIHPFADGQWRAYIFTKKLWLSGQTYLPALPKDHHPLPHTQGSTILGTIFHGLEITHTHSERLCSALAKWSGHTQNSYMIATTSPKGVKLSKRESEVLFFALRRKTAKLIAQALTLSPRTVEQYLDQLKQKFNARNKAELIDTAASQGYLNIIPRSLFSTQLSMILIAL